MSDTHAFATGGDALESSVAAHLRSAAGAGALDKTRPEFDSFTSRFDRSTTSVAIAYLGVQSRVANDPAARREITALARSLTAEYRADHLEHCVYVDELGFETQMIVAYWLDPHRFERWFVTSGHEWTTRRAGLGFFTEVVTPTMGRLETLHSSPRRLQGVASLAQGPSNPIYEHGYWGGMRDRIPESRTSTLVASGSVGRKPRAAGVVRIEPADNLCLIRSGQDYSATTGAEREFYLREVEPQLRAGMDFLRTSGGEIGCYDNRYVTVVAGNDTPTDKTFAVSFWRDIADLEAWARSHPTHLRIFDAFTEHMKTFGDDAKLRLYHEVAVVPRDRQYFEYAGCHERTGLLSAR
jgi:aldoxime dehydratase